MRPSTSVVAKAGHAPWGFASLVPQFRRHIVPSIGLTYSASHGQKRQPLDWALPISCGFGVDLD